MATYGTCRIENFGWLIVVICGHYNIAESVGGHQGTAPIGQYYKEQADFPAILAGPCCIGLHQDVADVW